MKKLLIAAVLLLQVTVFYGKPFANGRLEANAIDKVSGQALEYVAITLFDADHHYVKGFLSTANGHFSLKDLPYGNYSLKISITGYEEYEVALEISQDSTEVVLGPIALQPMSCEGRKSQKHHAASVALAIM